MLILVPLFSKVLLPEAAGTAKAVCALMAPVVGFFAVPVLVGLMTLLSFDFVTGLAKAMLLGKVSSARFGDTFTRAFYYLVVFTILHVMTLTTPQPYSMLVSLFEGFVMTGYLLKESISVLENLKAIQLARGVHDPVLDLLIHKLGIDTERIFNDFKHSALDPKHQNPSRIKLPGARYIRKLLPAAADALAASVLPMSDEPLAAPED